MKWFVYFPCSLVSNVCANIAVGSRQPSLRFHLQRNQGRCILGYCGGTTLILDLCVQEGQSVNLLTDSDNLTMWDAPKDDPSIGKLVKAANKTNMARAISIGQSVSSTHGL